MISLSQCTPEISLAVTIKTLAHIMSGVIFFTENAWEGYGAIAYSVAYNLSNNIPERILTIIIVMLLPVKSIKKNISN